MISPWDCKGQDFLHPPGPPAVQRELRLVSSRRLGPHFPLACDGARNLEDPSSLGELLLGKRRQDLNGVESAQGPVYPLAYCRCCKPRKTIFPSEDKRMRHTDVNGASATHSPCWFLVKFKSSMVGPYLRKRESGCGLGMDCLESHGPQD